MARPWHNSLTHQQTQVLTLLRAAIWAKPIDNVAIFDDHTDWKAIFRIANIQNITGLLADIVKSNSKELNPPIKVLQQSIYHLAQAKARYRLLEIALQKLTQLLSANSIPHVLLKGLGLSLNYPQKELRECGDLDVYIGTNNFEKACNLLLATEGTEQDDETSVKHAEFIFNGAKIELHRIAEQLYNPIGNSNFQRWTEQQLSNGKPRHISINEIDTMLPPTEFDVIYIFNHTWHHFLSSEAKLRQLCDLALYIDKFSDAIDRERLSHNLRQFRLLRPWQIFTCVLVKYIGLSADKCPLYDARYEKTADKVIHQIFNVEDSELTWQSQRDENELKSKLQTLNIVKHQLSSIYAIVPLYAFEMNCYYLGLAISSALRKLFGIKQQYHNTR